MTTDALIVGIVIVLAVGAVIALPLLQARDRKTKSDNVDFAAYLQDQLGQLVHAVQDLDFDFDTGKVSESVYVEQRKLLIGRGVSTLIRLDEALQEQATVDDEIEALIAMYREQFS